VSTRDAEAGELIESMTVVFPFVVVLMVMRLVLLTGILYVFPGETLDFVVISVPFSMTVSWFAVPEITLNVRVPFSVYVSTATEPAGWLAFCVCVVVFRATPIVTARAITIPIRRMVASVGETARSSSGLFISLVL
jgi:hypothetical protein